jgi:hypothetical protein
MSPDKGTVYTNDLLTYRGVGVCSISGKKPRLAGDATGMNPVQVGILKAVRSNADLSY